MKQYNITYNVGKVKYLVSFHDGEKNHKDGSNFYDIACFSNKNKLNKFVEGLLNEGYIYGNN